MEEKLMTKKVPEIRFSHDYFKLMGAGEKAILLQMWLVERDRLNKNFVAYDTCYEDKKGNLQYYELPKGQLLCLLFFSNTGELFTTMRPYNMGKEMYYKEKIGKWFKIVVGK
jgi:hypothetical protein